MSTETFPRLAYTRPEAAQVCGVSEDTIKRAHASGALRGKRTGKTGGKYLYTPESLRSWLEGLEDA